MDIREFLDCLDGRGIVFEDEDLVSETLHDMGLALFDKLIICTPEINKVWKGNEYINQLIQEKVKHD